MSRFDHIIARRWETKRKPRPIYDSAGPGRREVRMLDGKSVTTSAQHRQGHKWWREHFADLVDRRTGYTRISGWKYTPITRPVPTEPAAPVVAPSLLARPPGMTRQTHRRLFREACKLAGVPRLG